MRLFLFIGIVQSILLLGHWFFYFTLVRFLGITSAARLLTLRLSLGLLSVSLVLTTIFAFRYSNLLMKSLYTASASWLGILYFFILASILCWFFYGSAKLFHIALDRRILIEVLLGISLIFSLYGFINAGIIRITGIDIHLPNLPPSWRGKTAVWVSDLHLGQVRNAGFSGRVAAQILDLHPDILFIGGDLYDGEAENLDRAIAPFSKISAPYGTYFITGNHEEFGDNTRYLNAVRRAGIKVLDNEKIELDGLQIIGVDYRDTSRSDRFRAILQKAGIDRHKPSILLRHAPIQLQIAQEEGINLQLSGHSHRGQVFLFRFITSWVYHGYDYGLKKYGDLIIYTSSGVGTWGPPLRVDTKPEIVVIKFI